MGAVLFFVLCPHVDDAFIDCGDQCTSVTLPEPPENFDSFLRACFSLNLL